MIRPLRSRIGLRLAQLGGALMILGGAGDLAIRQLLPNQREFLGFAADPVPVATEMLVLAILHALGAALIAVGLAVLVLLRQAQNSGRPGPAVAAAAIVLLSEGPNALGMYRTGSPFFLAPLAFILLVLLGVALYTSTQPRFGVRLRRA